MIGSLLEQKFLDVLDSETLDELFVKYHQGDKEAFDKIVEHNIKLIFIIIKNSFHNTRISIDDLFEIGAYGLIKAVKAYDETKGIKFASFASSVIKNEILQEIRKEKKHKVVTSYNVKLGKKEDCELIDFISSSENIEEAYLEKELVMLVENFMKIENNKETGILSMTEKRVLNYIYGLNGFPQKKQYEIVEILNYTQSSVSKIVKRAIMKIRNYIKRYEYQVNFEKKHKVIEKAPHSLFAMFPNNSREEVMNVINKKLSEKEKEVLLRRFGNNIEFPEEPKYWSSEDHKLYFSVIIPKIQKNLFIPEKNAETRVIASNIYEVLKPYSDKKIKDAIDTLTTEEQNLLKKCYGSDYKDYCIISEKLDNAQRVKLKAITRKILNSLKARKENVCEKVEVTPKKKIVRKIIKFTDKVVENSETKIEKKKSLEELVNEQPYETTLILTLKCGFGTGKKYTIEEIAKMLRVKEEYVIYIINEFVRKNDVVLDEEITNKIDEERVRKI